MTDWISVNTVLPEASTPYDHNTVWVVVKTKSQNWYKACLCEYAEDDLRWVTEKGSEVLDVTHWATIDV